MLKKSIEEIKHKIRLAYQNAKHPNDKIRYQALKLLSEGYTRKQVSTITEKSLKSIAKWVTDYNKFGLESLKEKRTTGNRKKLTLDKKNKSNN